MGKPRRVRAFRYSGTARGKALRCSACKGLLCKGEGFRSGRKVLCGPCRLLTMTARRQGGLSQEDYDRTTLLLASRHQCESEGACRLIAQANLPPSTGAS